MSPMASDPPFPDIRSLWQDTSENRPGLPRLVGSHQFDIAIVGGGYTGLSTARYLAAKGLASVIIEASPIGWGASGRNGGVVEGKFRLSFIDIARRFGIETARRMHDLGNEAVDHVAELIDAYQIAAADYRPNGTMQCAHTQQAFSRLQEQAAWLGSTLGEKNTVVTRDQIEAEIGSGAFCGGVLHNRGGTIHPLNFVRGLAGGLQESGVPVFEESPVLSIRRKDGEIVLETPQGGVRARQVVLATNAYSDLTRATSEIRRTIVPFRSAMVATEPLSGAGYSVRLASGRSYSETRRMMRWFRMSGDRLLYGGRGAFGKADSESAFWALEKAMRTQFPGLRGAAITHRWSGLVALTLDSIPHLGRLNPQTCYAMGYNGLGVAMSSLMGKYVAKLVTGEKPDLGLLTASPLKPIPLYALRAPAVRCVAGWYQLLDAIGR
jgi:gamma-glutamylputrescine oxidase